MRFSNILVQVYTHHLYKSRVFWVFACAFKLSHLLFKNTINGINVMPLNERISAKERFIEKSMALST